MARSKTGCFRLRAPLLVTTVMSHPWRIVSSKFEHPTYRRRLGNTELAFYWDSVFFGTAITINHIEVDAAPDFERALFSETNVVKAWLRMKQRFPLLGASIYESADSDTVEFVVDERSLRARCAKDICLTEFDNPSGSLDLTDTLLNGPSPLSNQYSSRLWVAKEKDIASRYHVFIVLMHSINDGVAGSTAVREFLQELSSLSEDSVIPSSSIAKRLFVLAPVEDFAPIPEMSTARKRWREITAKIILDYRRNKQIGGHTLPSCPLRDFGEPAHSRTIRLFLRKDISERVLSSCRSLGITLGSALPVLSQLAISRVLHRRRSRIDDEEWEYRRVQPMHFGGPVNFRPYLNRAWFNHSGSIDICVAITFSFATLPFMPTRDQDAQNDHEKFDEDGVPSFDTLLSLERFVYRARLFQSQTKQQLRDPLFYEIHNAQTPRRVLLAKQAGLAWRAKEAGHVAETIEVPSTYNHRQCVFTNGGASIGNRDALIPQDYPTLNGRKNTRPRLHAISTSIHLRCRPSELYLGASMEQKQLSFFTFVDLKSYEEEVVKEWLEEIRSAAVHYLVGTKAQRSRF